MKFFTKSADQVWRSHLGRVLAVQSARKLAAPDWGDSKQFSPSFPSEFQAGSGKCVLADLSAALRRLLVLRMLICDASFAAIDFESAGAVRGGTDAPVQIGLAVLSSGQWDDAWAFVSYLQVDQPIVWSAQRVHGITREDLAGAPRLLELWPRLNATLRGRLVVSHGVGTEKRFLRAFPLHGFGPWIDTVKVAQAAFPDLHDYSLESLARQLGLKDDLDALCPGRRFHDALYDSAAALLVLWRIVTAAQLQHAPVEALLHPERSGYFARRRWRD